MDLLLNEQQRMLQATVQDLLRRDLPKNVLAAFDAGADNVGSRWSAIASTGLLGSLIPEEYGGVGGTFSDAGVVFEELGKGPVPGPAFSSGVLAALVLLEGGSNEQKAAHLPAIAEGREAFAAAITGPGYGWNPALADFDARDGKLSGVSLNVLDADAATHFLVAARTSEDPGVLLAILPVDAPGVSARPVSGMATGLGELRFDRVRIESGDILPDGARAFDRAVLQATAVLSAYQVGGLNRVFEMCLAYSQTRRQFQQPIGRFQRVQDHIIDIVNHLDAARWATNEALWKLDTGRPAEASVHMAAALASGGYYLACNAAHDVHAGVGIVREYGLTLHTKMSRTLYGHLGSPQFHRRQIAKTFDL